MIWRIIMSLKKINIPVNTRPRKNDVIISPKPLTNVSKSIILKEVTDDEPKIDARDSRLRAEETGDTKEVPNVTIEKESRSEDVCGDSSPIYDTQPPRKRRTRKTKNTPKEQTDITL